MNIFRDKYVTEEYILSHFSEEDIFSIVLGYKPEEGIFITSPLREDTNAGCTFHYYNDRLRFIDFASKTYVRGKKVISFDCFTFLKVYFNIQSDVYLYSFIFKSLTNQNITPKKLCKPHKSNTEKTSKVILSEIRDYLIWDVKYWTNRYGITIQNLYEDKVFPITSYSITSDTTIKTYQVHKIGYSYSEFKQGRVKLYFPKNNKKYRFISTCVKNDIGGIHSLCKITSSIVITKSYKDWRVLKNQGINAIWFQNEGMIPDLDVLLPVLYPYRDVVIFFDNDNSGKEASKALKNILKSYLSSSIREVFLDEEKDPSDYLYSKGEKALSNFIIKNKLK